MGFAKSITVALLTAALGLYAADCSAMLTPQQAMQCCKTMHCPSSLHHTQHCCRTMPNVRAALGQPSSIQSAPLAHTISAPLPVANMALTQVPKTSSYVIADFHSPPAAFSPPAFSLRI
jgi:hypothetical protein